MLDSLTHFLFMVAGFLGEFYNVCCAVWLIHNDVAKPPDGRMRAARMKKLFVW